MSSFTRFADQFVHSESAFIVSGLGYNPRTGHYDASRNVRIRSIELAPNFKVRTLPSCTRPRCSCPAAQILLDSWNINTNVWLRECIYKRVAKKGRKPGCVKSSALTGVLLLTQHALTASRALRLPSSPLHCKSAPPMPRLKRFSHRSCVIAGTALTRATS